MPGDPLFRKQRIVGSPQVWLCPPLIHGHLNPIDEGFWLGVAQSLIEGKVLYRDVFVHFGPLIPLILKAGFFFCDPTVTTVRFIFWGLNVMGLLVVYFCLLKFTRSFWVRLVLAICIFCVPLAAHITTVPFSIRYASGLMAVLFWPLKENDRGVGG